MVTVVNETLDEQRGRALREANRVRIGRARMLKRMHQLPPRDSLLEATEAVCDPPDILAGLSVDSVLGRVRRLNRSSRAGLLFVAKVTPGTLLGDIRPGRRVTLAAAMRDYAEGLSSSDAQIPELLPDGGA